ncbi:MAG: NAD-binding protein, partial [Thermoleophilaceae bacterium]
MAGPTPTHCFLLIGRGLLAEATARALEAGGGTVRRLDAPPDREIREALDERVDHVVVISRHDHLSLRYALVVEHIRPGIELLVTIFDRDVAAHLRDTVDNVHVLSMADIVAPAFAGPCLDPSLLSVVRGESGAAGVHAIGGQPAHVPQRWSTPSLRSRALTQLGALLRPFDSSALILVYGLFGV